MNLYTVKFKETDGECKSQVRVRAENTVDAMHAAEEKYLKKHGTFYGYEIDAVWDEYGNQVYSKTTGHRNVGW
ncbi:MAG: hypothetical protein WC444_05230 [Candidatus Paceibacterota bacterium]